MPHITPPLRILRALFDLSRHEQRSSLGLLREATGLTTAALSESLQLLRSAGLVSSEPPRLTMRGLAVAAALGSVWAGPRRIGPRVVTSRSRAELRAA